MRPSRGMPAAIWQGGDGQEPGKRQECGSGGHVSTGRTSSLLARVSQRAASDRPARTRRSTGRPGEEEAFPTPPPAVPTRKVSARREASDSVSRDERTEGKSRGEDEQGQGRVCLSRARVDAGHVRRSGSAVQSARPSTPPPPPLRSAGRRGVSLLICLWRSRVDPPRGT